jgi:hypothetical protein
MRAIPNRCLFVGTLTALCAVFGATSMANASAVREAKTHAPVAQTARVVASPPLLSMVRVRRHARRVVRRTCRAYQLIIPVGDVRRKLRKCTSPTRHCERISPQYRYNIWCEGEFFEILTKAARDLTYPKTNLDCLSSAYYQGFGNTFRIQRGGWVWHCGEFAELDSVNWPNTANWLLPRSALTVARK